MATTRLIPMHVIKGKTASQSVEERLKYAMNEDKTDNGTLVSAYGCDPKTAISEMLLCRKQHEILCGNSESVKNDVILYQIRQSFKPGEITPELAQRIGCELAMRFTKGKHQFVVSTHVDHAHIHNHIIFNATSMDYTQKFRNFYGSSKAIRGISDRLCLENGLSIVEDPNMEHDHYGKWLGNRKPMARRDRLRLAIDLAIAHRPTNFDEFRRMLLEEGVEMRTGRMPAVRMAGQDRFTGLRTLGEGYELEDLLGVIRGEKLHTPKAGKLLARNPAKVNLIMDIQKQLQAGKGPGYERWAKVFNLKQMAKTLNYLMEHRLYDLEVLEKHVGSVKTDYQKSVEALRMVERKLEEYRQLMEHVRNYARTREAFVAYREGGYREAYAEEHADELRIYKEVVSVFQEMKAKRISVPKLILLISESRQLVQEKKRKANLQKQLIETLHDLQNIESNSLMILERNGPNDGDHTR